MRNENVYITLIYFTIFIFTKKILDIIVEINVPTYKDLDKKSEFVKMLVKIRDLLSLVTIVSILYLFCFYKLNKYLVFLFALLLVYNIEYFLIDHRFIYYFFNNNAFNNKTIDFLDTNSDMFYNFIISVYCMYVLVVIFS
jgi:hypothetical protein